MYNPCVKKGKNRVPILSRGRIDDIAEEYLKEYQPEALKTPMEIDIEGFMENYLGAIPDYQFLSHNMIYLGMTIFHDSNHVIVYDPELNEAKYISAKAKTIIIDMRLLDKMQEHRFRFTLGHESGHLIFHKMYFEYLRRLARITGEENTLQMRCLNSGTFGSGNLNSDIDWIEWQANQFSSSFLMPKTVVLSIINDYGTSSSSIKNAMQEMKSIFNVSTEAVSYRLRNLGIIDTEIQ